VSLQQALQRLAANPVPVLAGGTDFYPALQDEAPPSDVIDITGLSELQGITAHAQDWRIGAAATWTEVLKADLPAAFDGLRAAAREVGSVQIQNKATVVGNVCNASPAADGVPALLALNASVELQRMDATRLVPLQEFISGVRSTVRQPDELVTAIRVPMCSNTQQSTFVKLGARRYLVISIAMLAVNLECDAAGKVTQAAIAIGACSPVAVRLAELESAIIGLTVHDASEQASVWQENIARAHLRELAPIDDVRGSAHYRQQVVRTLLQRTLAEVAQRCTQLPSVHNGNAV